MHVVATAGHVDHGKSTLVQALTGQQPDRWEQERRRGLTIDLGYVWCTLGSGRTIAFVDVPGHSRFIGNMLAGLGPAPAVMFVVAADEGWSAQSTEHLAAADALGVGHGLLVATKCDLADPAVALAGARARLKGTSLEQIPQVTVSARTGQGMDGLRSALDALAAGMPQPDPEAPARLWIDRAFTIRGSGTVVTGTLGAGTIRVGDRVDVLGEQATHPSVRGLQALEQPRDAVEAVARVAVNLRGVTPDRVPRGSLLVAAGSATPREQIDVRLQLFAERVPHGDLQLHVGTAAVGARLRPLGRDVARILLGRSLPLRPGDRGVLRDPAAGRIVAGVLVLDVEPPRLARRGDAARRAIDLAHATAHPDPGAELRRRGCARVEALTALGIPRQQVERVAGARRVGTWLVDQARWQQWLTGLGALVDRQQHDNPLRPWVPADEARRALGIPDGVLLQSLSRQCGLRLGEGRVSRPGVEPSLGGAEDGLRRLEEQLTADPFAAPEHDQLHGWGLGPRQLAAAERAGRIVRIADGVVLLPHGPAQAMRALVSLPQPFTTSQARQALKTTRRVAVPLLEYLDGRGWTRRIDAGHREVVR